MTKLVQEVFGKLEQLPEAEQDAIADALRDLLPDAGQEAEWERLTADPRSDQLIELLVSKAELEVEAGETADRDPGTA